MDEDLLALIETQNTRIDDLEKLSRVLTELVERHHLELTRLLSQTDSPKPLTTRTTSDFLKDLARQVKAEQPAVQEVVHNEGYETISYARPNAHTNRDGDTDFGDFNRLNEPY